MGKEATVALEGEAAKFEEHRAEARKVVDRYYSVEVKIKALLKVYQCKLRDVSSRGACIVVRENSPLLRAIKPGMVLQMRYYPVGHRRPPEELATRIAHITPQDRGRYRGHCLIGLTILEDEGESCDIGVLPVQASGLSGSRA